MPYPIERKLVVGISSNALFDLIYESKLFGEQGIEEYKKYQIANKNNILNAGVAYPFIKRYLNINSVYSEEKPVEVVLLSKNSPETGIRIFNSIRAHGLDISRAAFTAGECPYKYIPAYNISLFLSTDEDDVLDAIEAKYPAGRVLKTDIKDDEKDMGLRVAFDFDGVITDDESERIYKQTGDLDLFHEYETDKVDIPLNPGLLADFFKKLSFFQKLENRKLQQDKNYKKILKIAIITARNSPAHERAINTLRSWEVDVDNMFFLGGIDKRRVLEVMKPHLYIDDQLQHLDKTIKDIPLVHIPFGIANQKNLIEKENAIKKPNIDSIDKSPHLPA